jgi:micrococcal nuclease
VTVPGTSVRGVTATVTHVVDGDTVDLAISGGGTERARLLGIDTPETVRPDRPVECFGPEASNRTKALLAEGTEVVVQRDEEARDRYGRLLVYVWRRADGLFVNRALVADGYARTLSIAPNRAHAADLAAAAAGARDRGAGLWGACPAEPEDRGGPGA